MKFLADTCHFCGKAVTTIAKVGFGDDEDRARDILGRTYEYFLTRFAAARTTVNSEFYTPRSVIRLLVEMLEPYKGVWPGAVA